MIQAMQHGLGTHMLALTNKQFTVMLKVKPSCQNAYTNADFFFVHQALIIAAARYQLAVVFTQLSIVFLYKRIFTLHMEWFRNTLYVLGALIILCEIPIFFAGLFYCTPVSYAWDKTVEGGHCYDVQKVFDVALVLNLVVDIAIVVSPIKLIWDLQMSRSAKLGVIGILLLGSLWVSICEPKSSKVEELTEAVFVSSTWYDFLIWSMLQRTIYHVRPFAIFSWIIIGWRTCNRVQRPRQYLDRGRVQSRRHQRLPALLPTALQKHKRNHLDQKRQISQLDAPVPFQYVGSIQTSRGPRNMEKRVRGRASAFRSVDFPSSTVSCSERQNWVHESRRPALKRRGAGLVS